LAHVTTKFGKTGLSCPKGKTMPGGEITTLDPVKGELTAPNTLTQTLADGSPLLASVTRTEYDGLDVRGPVDRVEAVLPVICAPVLQPGPSYHW
jgi:hypothetical protein